MYIKFVVDGAVAGKFVAPRELIIACSLNGHYEAVDDVDRDLLLLVLQMDNLFLLM